MNSSSVGVGFLGPAGTGIGSGGARFKLAWNLELNDFIVGLVGAVSI